MKIPASAFQPIIDEIQRRCLPLNNERKTSGKGRSVAFGVVKKRTSENGYSRHCRDRPHLYSLILQFAKAHVPSSLVWNSIQCNENYECRPHLDSGNEGLSLVVAFGSYVGGELVIEGTKYDIKHTYIINDFTNKLHWVEPFKGNRYSLVFYYTPVETNLPPPSVRLIGDKWIFYNGEQAIYPYVKKRKKKVPKEHTKHQKGI